MDPDNGYAAPGLPADWLNAWLAAIGVLSIIPEVRLAWTRDVVPHPVFSGVKPFELVGAIADALPSSETLATTSIARTHPDGHHEFGRTVTIGAYAERAAIERQTHDYLLGGSVSDAIMRGGVGEIDHGAFDPPMPAGMTLWSRAVRCRELLDGIDDIEAAVEATLAGRAKRQAANGLGFCARRYRTGVQPSGGDSVHVDPVVELLALCGLKIFPVRGDGRSVRQRGWTAPSTRRGSFMWPTWTPSLSLWAIDALLDQPQLADGPRWQVVPYIPANSKDPKRAYFSERAP